MKIRLASKHVNAIKKSLQTIILLSLVGILTFFGFSYNDFTYFVLASIAFVLLVISLINREDLPSIHIGYLAKHSSREKSAEVKMDFNSIKNRKEDKQKTIFHFAIGLIFSTIFIGYLLIAHLQKSTGENFSVQYFTSLVNFHINNYFVIGIGIFVLLLLNFVLNKKTKLTIKSFKIIKVLFELVGKSLIQILFGSLLAPIIIFIITVFVFDLMVLYTSFNSQIISLITDKNEIRKVIESTNGKIDILGVGDSPARALLKLFANKYPFGSFYKENLISTIPQSVLLKTKDLEKPIYLVGKTLVVREIDKEVFQTIAPTLVKKLIRKNLAPRYIKDEPEVTIISRQDYLKYRESEINKQVEIIAGYINDAKKLLGNYGYNIGVARNNISTLQGYIAQNSQIRDEEYNSCMSATYTYYGIYSNYTYRRYSDAYCQQLKAYRDQQTAQYQDDLRTNQNNLAYYQSLYSELNEYLNQFENYKVFIESTKSQTPYELGIFEPDKSIKVVLETVSEKDINNFLVTLTHEYIHYTSYVSEERALPQFFEEGLTEILARKVVKDELHKDTNIGYPIVVKIINAMTKKISIDKLEEIYFTKNEDELAGLLDEAFGKNFYKDSMLYFALIPLSPVDEALKFANNLIFKIGGETLNEDDFKSTF